MKKITLVFLMLFSLPLTSYALTFTGNWIPIQGIIESVNLSTGQPTVSPLPTDVFQSPSVVPPPPTSISGNVGDPLIEWGNPLSNASRLVYSPSDANTEQDIFTFGTIFFDNTSITITGDDGRPDLILGVFLHLDEQNAVDALGTPYTIPAKDHLLQIHNILNSQSRTDFLDLLTNHQDVTGNGVDGAFLSRWNEANEGASHSATIQGTLELNGMAFNKELFPLGVTAARLSSLQSASPSGLPQEPIELDLVNIQFGEVLSGGGTVSNAPIPEPSTILLMTTGLIAIGFLQRKFSYHSRKSIRYSHKSQAP